MVEFVYLQGAEQVQRAASTMSDAARQMQSAASNMEYVLERHQRFLDDWLGRFETVVDKLKPQELSNG